jgi:hypothetical protein
VTSEDPQTGVHAALQALAREGAAMQTSIRVQQQLLAEVRSIAAERRSHSRQTLLAVAAVIVAAVAVVSWRLTPPPPPTLTGSTPAANKSADVMTAFLPLVYGNVPTTDVRIVRLELPRTALAAFGLVPVESLDDRQPATVTADVIVGEDGLARAVRFVRPGQ